MTTTYVQDQQYFVGLKAFIENQGKLLILQSNPKGIYASSFWGLPGGKITIEECSSSFSDTLMREIEEELGQNFKVSIGEPFYSWKFLTAKHPILLVGFHCKYQSGDIDLASEFASYKWIDVSSDLDYPFLAGHLEAIKFWNSRSLS